MSRASRVSNPPTAAAPAAKKVSSNGGHSDPSCSASVYQSSRPITRSMTRVHASVVASSGVKGGGSVSTSKSISNASFSIQSAALRPTAATRARTPQKVTTSAWKPLTQPVALREGQKCAMNLTAKRSKVASNSAAKDSTNHSASKSNSTVLSGKKNQDEETTSQGDQQAAVMPSPTKKLQTCKFPSGTCSRKVPSIRIIGGKAPAQLPRGMSQIESGKDSASVPPKVASASAIYISPSADSAVPFPAQQLQLDTAKNSSVITETVNNEASHVQPMSAKFVNLPRPKLPTDYQMVPSDVPMTMNQVSGLAGVNAPMPLPKFQIGNAKDTSNVFSNPAYARALLIKHQQQLLQKYKLGSSQQQQQELYIKGPALPWSDGMPPPIEPLGIRCQLCKLDVTFRPQGDAGRDASAPPVVAVLACHHAFHSSCIESIYGPVEPSQCIACAEAGPAQIKLEASV